MEMEPVPGYDYANWERGYGDFHMAPDLATMRVAAWAASELEYYLYEETYREAADNGYSNLTAVGHARRRRGHQTCIARARR